MVPGAQLTIQLATWPEYILILLARGSALQSAQQDAQARTFMRMASFYISIRFTYWALSHPIRTECREEKTATYTSDKNKSQQNRKKFPKEIFFISHFLENPNHAKTAALYLSFPA